MSPSINNPSLEKRIIHSTPAEHRRLNKLMMLELISSEEIHSPFTDSLASFSSEEGEQSNLYNAPRTRRRRHKRRHRRRKLSSPFKGPDLPIEEQEQYVAMDCEMVGVGRDGWLSALARVTLLDWNGNVILDTLVRPVQDVTDYRTFVSGITADDFLLHDNVMDFDACRSLVLSLIHDKVVIGHGLKNDFHALHIYNHPWYLQRDTAKYEPFLQKEDEFDATAVFHNSFHLDCSRRPKARKLKELVYEKLHRSIQPMGRVHDPVEDAMGALDLYKLVRVKWEKCMAYKMERTKQILSEQIVQQISVISSTPCFEQSNSQQQLCVGW